MKSSILHCNQCHQFKDRSKFHDHGTKRSYVRQPCKSCVRSGYTRKSDRDPCTARCVPKLKECTGCKKVYPMSGFWKRKNGRYGLSSRCISCMAERHRLWVDENPDVKPRNSRLWYARCREEIRKRQQKRGNRLRKTLIEKMGGRCACCGEHRWSMLEIDHVNNDGHIDRQISRGNIYLRMLRLGCPPEKYQVLCSNCNQSKRRMGGTCQHKKEQKATG